jgi:hypothetical protein
VSSADRRHVDDEDRRTSTRRFEGGTETGNPGTHDQHIPSVNQAPSLSQRASGLRVGQAEDVEHFIMQHAVRSDDAFVVREAGS